MKRQNQKLQLLHRFVKSTLDNLNHHYPKSYSLELYTKFIINNEKNIEFTKLSNQAKSFIHKHSQTIQKKDFKQLGILLNSDLQILFNNQKRNQYLQQAIKVKCFFILLLQFLIHQKIQFLDDYKINQEDLSWSKFNQYKHLYPHGISNQKTSRQNLSIQKYNNTGLKMLINLPSQWKYFLDDKTVKDPLYEYSLLIAQQPEAIQQNFLLNMYKRILIYEENFKWKQALNLSQKIRNSKDKNENKGSQFFSLLSISRNIINNSHRQYNIQKRGIQQTSKLNKQQNKQNDLMEENIKNMIQKIKVIKKSFIFIHKYYLYKDIKLCGLTKQQAQKYANHLDFQMYLPYKLSLSLQITLDYQDWFQVFFTEYDYNRSNQEISQRNYIILDAAHFLINLIQLQGNQILKVVKNCELSDLKRIQYLLSLKVKNFKLSFKNQLSLSTYQFITYQVSHYSQNKRTYQTSFQQFKKYLHIKKINFQAQTLLHTLQKFVLQFDFEAYHEILLLSLALYQIIGQEKFRPKKQSKNQKSSQQIVYKQFPQLLKDFKKHHKINYNQLQQSLACIQGTVASNEKFLQSLKDNN